MERAALATLAALLALAAYPAQAQIYRCTSPSGDVTYQQDPCAARESTKVVDVPASYPAVDSAERDRLFAREAALDQRLEAERERWSRETIAQAMQPAPMPAADEVPDVVWAGVPVGFHRWHPRRAGMRGGMRPN
ncbi:MAG TPA: DUF4124 domain-containing protein [Usitatibacter sp.]|nr:DUF4124 domain-containing protein [Usitatibacter sp.]